MLSGRLFQQISNGFFGFFSLSGSAYIDYQYSRIVESEQAAIHCCKTVAVSFAYRLADLFFCHHIEGSVQIVFIADFGNECTPEIGES